MRYVQPVDRCIQESCSLKYPACWNYYASRHQYIYIGRTWHEFTARDSIVYNTTVTGSEGNKCPRAQSRFGHDHHETRVFTDPSLSRNPPFSTAFTSNVAKQSRSVLQYMPSSLSKSRRKKRNANTENMYTKVFHRLKKRYAVKHPLAHAALTLAN